MLTSLITLNYYRIYTSVAFLFITFTGYTQTDTVFVKYSEEPPGLDSLFYSETPINCTIKTDFKNFQRKKYKAEYQKAQFIYNYNDTLFAKNIKIRARGVVRKRICTFPPIRIKFQKNKEAAKKNFSNKIKLVTHCNSHQNYSNYLLKEYLTYKIYNILTPYSFRVRLLKLTYIDTGRKNKQMHKWAFLIEPIEMVAERQECVPIKQNYFCIMNMDSASTDLLSMWTYMIGSTDWSIAGRHNVKLLKHSDFNKPYPIAVPYDFDYCGLVNTYYALPGEGLGISDVKERLYVGPCRDIDDYTKAAKIIQLKEKEIYELISSFEFLDSKSKSEMLAYLESFFNLIEKPNFIKYHIDTDCRSPGYEDE